MEPYRPKPPRLKRILGALLDAAVTGIRNLPHVKIDELPRLADFTAWVTACEETSGVSRGAFLEAYETNRTDVQNLALEVSPLYESLRELAGIPFRGTTSDPFSSAQPVDQRRYPPFTGLAQEPQCAW